MAKRLRDAEVKKVISVNPHGLFTTDPIDIVTKFDGFYIGDVTEQDNLEGLNTISLAQLVGDEVYKIFTERNSVTQLS